MAASQPLGQLKTLPLASISKGIAGSPGKDFMNVCIFGPVKCWW